jgi:two-component system LytT family response regulator
VQVHRSTLLRIGRLKQIKVLGDGVYSLTLKCGAPVAVSERHVE